MPQLTKVLLIYSTSKIPIQNILTSRGQSLQQISASRWTSSCSSYNNPYVNIFETLTFRNIERSKMSGPPKIRFDGRVAIVTGAGGGEWDKYKLLVFLS